MEIARDNWSGEGVFTQALLDTLQTIEQIDYLRVEDAPATRSEAGYNLISNEVYVRFRARREGGAWRVFLPLFRKEARKTMTMAELERALGAVEEIGAPDYADERMLQYLHTERVVPPYQTRGYKLVELVRIYEV